MKKIRKKIAFLLLACLAASMLCLASCGEDTSMTASDGNDGSTEQKQENVSPADVVFSSDMKKVTYYADINIKDYGKITVALDGGSAPITVENFVSLAKDGFYDGLTFHRIMEGFMMQGGDPLGTGTGGADEEIKGEFAANGVANSLTHVRGAVSMARASSYDSGSSQFFIVHEDSTFLDGDYAAFGYVTEGLDVVDAVCEAAQPIDGNGTIPAASRPVITSIVIREAE